mmetsp:Transcript_26820/g.86624  ORF Transcript_26820/g.86624 Transcript_26820/m.86624 type:complete len:263 (+) Transcript_26820:467-1255(+)|eukprot:scaffold1727_cov119-Isochrysis_galbana.AAC.3
MSSSSGTSALPNVATNAPAASCASVIGPRATETAYPPHTLWVQQVQSCRRTSSTYNREKEGSASSTSREPSKIAGEEDSTATHASLGSPGLAGVCTTKSGTGVKFGESKTTPCPEEAAGEMCTSTSGLLSGLARSGRSGGCGGRVEQNSARRSSKASPSPRALAKASLRLHWARNAANRATSRARPHGAWRCSAPLTAGGSVAVEMSNELGSGTGWRSGLGGRTLGVSVKRGWCGSGPSSAASMASHSSGVITCANANCTRP